MDISEDSIEKLASIRDCRWTSTSFAAFGDDDGSSDGGQEIVMKGVSAEETKYPCITTSNPATDVVELRPTGGAWSRQNLRYCFHPDLILKQTPTASSDSTSSDCVWMTFQAKARESISVVITPSKISVAAQQQQPSTDDKDPSADANNDSTTSTPMPDGLPPSQPPPTQPATTTTTKSFPSFHNHISYQIHIGNMGNTNTTLQRKNNSERIVSRPCSSQDWVSYWICLSISPSSDVATVRRLYVGTGTKLGWNCIGVLDDSFHPKSNGKCDATKDAPADDDVGGENKAETQNDEMTEQPEEETKEATADDSTNKDTENNGNDDGKARSRDDSLACYYVGFKNTARTGGERSGESLMLRNIVVSNSHLSAAVQQQLDSLPLNANEEMDICCMIDDESTKKLLRDYQAECRKRRARAKKFGTPYEIPSSAKLLSWSDVKRMRTTPQLQTTDGIITGIDVLSPEELAKQEKRKARFAAMKAEGDDEQAGDANADATTGGSTMMDVDDNRLPVNQAWDKEILLSPHRIHLPQSLWKTPPPAQPQSPFQTSAPAALVDTKIHISAIDWCAFKQIRTNDIMAHFNDYGPTYVEWLGDLSANVHFGDMFATRRALHNVTQALPSPPPDISELNVSVNKRTPSNYTVPDLHNYGWRFCLQPIRKISNDRHGCRNTRARFLARPATTLDILEERPSTWPTPPAGFSTDRVMGPNSDYNHLTSTQKSNKKRGRGGGQSSSNNSNAVGQNKRERRAETAPKKRKTQQQPAEVKRESITDRLSRGLSASRGSNSKDAKKK